MLDLVALTLALEEEAEDRDVAPHPVHPLVGPLASVGAFLPLEDDLDAAATRFNTTLELVGDDPARAKDRSKALTRLADVDMRRADFESAKSRLLVATELYPDHYEAFYKLFRVHMRLGETEEAEAAQSAFTESRQRVRPGTRFPE